MEIILEDFYYGKLHPNELVKPNNPEIQQLNRKIADALQKLQQNLGDRDLEQLEKLLELQIEMDSLQSALSFIQGYKIGALMMIEVLSGGE
ncbi:DUF6809 family protein [Paenibacillus sp. DMB5]|uniref:DUF6809 family protein n=1 Tax=Paenibacillus sp. DMB5 TaxID=1780103 RepID=UPI00076C7C91|nr:DUF6809 family protein [Paenibacillus sp. DMB5]KUP23384.1 hypothetical protein AWJ19_28845 [Paenibacillus sp. DMB5]